MNRRSFTATLAALAVNAHADVAGRVPSRRFYALQSTRARQRLAGPRPILLEAQFGANLPELLAVSEVPSPEPAGDGLTVLEGSDLCINRKHLFELRTYPSAPRPVANRFRTVFARAGIRPMLSGLSSGVSFLIPFENLSAREQAWNSLNADPEWLQIRDQAGPYQFSLYRLRA